MRRGFRHITALVLLSCVAVLAGCASRGTRGPAAPPGADELTLRYCRVVEVDYEMHVQWAADVPTRGEIRYGRTGYTSNVTVPAYRDTHDVILTGLAFAARYVYRVTIFDSLSRTAVFSGDFVTPPKATPEPQILGLEILNLTESSAEVRWRTDEPATTILYYGSPQPADSIVRDTFAVQHQVVLSGLRSATQYRVRPEAVDSSGLRGVGRDSSFVTLARMQLSFPDTGFAVNDTLRLPIRIAATRDLAGLRFAMSVAPSVVEIAAVEQGPFYTDRGGFVFFSRIQRSVGRVSADMSWSIHYQGNTRAGTDADGDGVVAYVLLRGLTAGSAQAQFLADSTFGLDMYASVRPCSLRAGTVMVGP